MVMILCPRASQKDLAADHVVGPYGPVIFPMKAEDKDKCHNA